VVPVNTVPAYTVVAVVGERLFGLFTRIARMSERPQLSTIARTTCGGKTQVVERFELVGPGRLFLASRASKLVRSSLVPVFIVAWPPRTS